MLREFDQIEFYTVTESEFSSISERFKTGRYRFEYQDTTFDPESYAAFLASIKDETESFIRRRNEAGKAATLEEQRLLSEWRDRQKHDEGGVAEGEETAGIQVVCPMTSSVWKIQVKPGDTVKDGQVLVILEAMKMEIRKSDFQILTDKTAVRADASMDGKTVGHIAVQPGRLLDPGEVIMTIKE